MSGIAERRREYLERAVSEAEAGGVHEVTLDETNGRRLWALNYARLALGRDLDRANAYFERVVFDPRPVLWKDGTEDTADWDFLGTDLLKTVLDFGGTDGLSEKAKAHLRSLILNWEQPRPAGNMDNDRVARWPAIHTENHDLMCLTIGLFREAFAGRDTASHVRELARSLAWRIRRGWVEWHSPCYQVHWLAPALILARHAPSEPLREGARAAVNLQMAERALLSVAGHLGGPFYRGYDKHIESDRVDGYLPVMWMAFGLGGEVQNPREGVAFAGDTFEPHPVVRALAAEAASRPVLAYRGARHVSWPFPEEGASDRRLVSYFNTPHVSMGSMRACGYGFQSRFFNVMFADDPSKGLRTYLRDPVEHTPWDKRNERGEVAQHGSWLVSRGALVEEGGLAPVRVGDWHVYRVGKGLCAHAELPGGPPAGGGLHVFQVSDLERYPSVRDFVAALAPAALAPAEVAPGCVTGTTLDGDRVRVDLAEMSLSANGEPQDWSDMLHDCPDFPPDRAPMRSAYGSGVVEVATDAGKLTISDRPLLPLLDG